MNFSAVLSVLFAILILRVDSQNILPTAPRCALTNATTNTYVQCKVDRTAYGSCTIDSSGSLATPSPAAPQPDGYSKICAANTVCYGGAAGGDTPCWTKLENSACKGTGYFKAPGTCVGFYSCTGVGVLATQAYGFCDGGREFSIAAGSCLIAANANCSPNVETLVPPTSTSTSTTTSTTTPSPTTSTTTPPTTTIFPANCSPLSTYPDPTSCRSYYKCRLLGGGASRRSCPFGMSFNTGTRRCSFNADCGTRPN